MPESARLRAVQSPIIPVIGDLCRAHPGTISLGQGVVHWGPPPPALAAAARFPADPALHKYQPVAGLPALVDALAARHAAEHGFSVGPAHGNRLMVTAGGNNAFFAALLAVLDAGDEVILPTPCYFNHEMAVTMVGARPVCVPTDADHQLDLAALAAAITPRTRAIVTVSPNNPAGTVYPAAALRAVNALCAARGLWHLCDEAYADFTYDGAKHFSPAAESGAAAHTLTLGSLSKAHGFAGWRLGWLVFPEILESALRKIQDTLLICPPVVSQVAALGALDASAGGGTPYVREKLGSLVRNRALVRDALAPLIADGLVSVPPAAGAFYFLLRVRSTLAPLALAERLIREHGVATIPGTAFGLGPADGCRLRVAYGALEGAAAAEALARLTRGLRALAG